MLTVITAADSHPTLTMCQILSTCFSYLTN